jgi:hypothetical protein
LSGDNLRECAGDLPAAARKAVSGLPGEQHAEQQAEQIMPPRAAARSGEVSRDGGEARRERATPMTGS